MKCIECGTDNNLKDRTANQGRCKNCNHRFAFEPTAMSPKARFTDQFFANILNNISANNTLYFTRKQFFYLLEKKLAKKDIKTAAGGLMGLGLVSIIAGFFFLGTNIGLPMIFIGAVIFVIAWQQSKRQPKSPRSLFINQSITEAWLQSWRHANSTPEKLLQQPRQQYTQATIESDVTAYSFDRLVVCDRDEIAQMLIANNFHFDNNCAVLSITGYPHSIFNTTMEMLRRNPDLRVYGLHDCNPSGMELVHQLQTNANWFAQSNVVIVDVGLLPRQIMAAKRNMLVQVSETSAAAAKALPPEIRQKLLASELVWLESGNFVDLESFTPIQLMQILNRSIAKSRELSSEGDDLILEGDGNNYSDRDNYFYVLDNFG